MRYLIQLGTKVMVDERGGIDQQLFANLAAQIAKLWQQGVRVGIAPSYGAILPGYQQLSWGSFDPSDSNLSDCQQAIAVGQPFLMAQLNSAFAEHNLRVGQFTFTKEQLKNASLHDGIIALVTRALDKKSAVVPVILDGSILNSDGLKKIAQECDGDSFVCDFATLLKINKVAFLCNVDGIRTANKGFAQNIHSNGIITHLHTRDQLQAVRRELENGAKPQKSPAGTEGLLSKFNHAHRLYGASISSWIVNSREENVLLRVHQQEAIGTHIDPKCAPASPKPSRQ